MAIALKRLLLHAVYAVGVRIVAYAPALARAVARNLFKLMAHKDEWEVARLYARPEFRQELERTFEGDYRLKFHVAGGPFGRRDPVSGKLVKREVGPWLMTAFRLMSPMRGLRGSVLDPFRYSGERRLARDLLAGYEADLERSLAGLSADTHATAVKLASLPEKIRGYGHVREAHVEAVASERAALLSAGQGTVVLRVFLGLTRPVSTNIFMKRRTERAPRPSTVAMVMTSIE